MDNEFLLESEVRCSDNDRQLVMTESNNSSLRRRVLTHAMDTQYRKCNWEYEGIPEAPTARCNVRGPFPAQPYGKLSTDRAICRRGIHLVLLVNCATLCLSVLGAHTVRTVLPFDFVFIHSFFMGFPSAFTNCATFRISHFLGDSGTKTFLDTTTSPCHFLFSFWKYENETVRWKTVFHRMSFIDGTPNFVWQFTKVIWDEVVWSTRLRSKPRNRLIIVPKPCHFFRWVVAINIQGDTK